MTNRELEQLVNEISSIQGDGTELVTLTIPPDSSLQRAIQQVAAEHAEASNIKSKQTRANVQQALSRLRRELSTYESVPEHGLVCYVGVAADDFIVHVLDDELPLPVDEAQYRCDDVFQTDVLERMLEPDSAIGMVINGN